MTTGLQEIAEQVRQGELAAAEQALASLAPTEDTEAEVQFLRGYLLERQDDWPGAVAAYTQALDRQPDHSAALFRSALLHDRLGNDDTALRLYERCATHDPAPVNALLNLAVLYEERNRLDEAAACLESVLEHYPEHHRARQFRKSVRSSYNMYYDERTQRDREIRSAILDTPITDFELSVRSRNCLKQMNIRSLGDLLRITEAELLSYKNFGETSLNEIKAMLAQKGLRLGQAVQGMTAPPSPTPPPQANEKSAVLMRPVAELELSVRARRCLQRLGVVSIGELVNCTEAELTAMKNFGQTSLAEIKRQLANLGLGLRTSPEA